MLHASHLGACACMIVSSIRSRIRHKVQVLGDQLVDLTLKKPLNPWRSREACRLK